MIDNEVRFFVRKKLIVLALLLGLTVSSVPLSNGNFVTVYAAQTAETDTVSDGVYIRDSHIYISTQPQSVTVTEGEDATFFLQASGKELTYQWQVSDDEGATWRDSVTTTPTYTVTPNREKDRRLVRCVVTDADGHTVISQMARLTVVTEAQLNVNMDDFEIEGDTLVRYKGNAEEVYIPDGVKRIAFSDKESGKNAKSIIIPASVTDIQVFSFHQTGWYANNVIFPNLER